MSLHFAASLCGYHKDYLGQMIRSGKLRGERIGSSWFLEEAVFSKFLEENSPNIEQKPLENPAPEIPDETARLNESSPTLKTPPVAAGAPHAAASDRWIRSRALIQRCENAISYRMLFLKHKKLHTY